MGLFPRLGRVLETERRSVSSEHGLSISQSRWLSTYLSCGTKVIQINPRVRAEKQSAFQRRSLEKLKLANAIPPASIHINIFLRNELLGNEFHETRIGVQLKYSAMSDLGITDAAVDCSSL